MLDSTMLLVSQLLLTELLYKRNRSGRKFQNEVRQPAKSGYQDQNDQAQFRGSPVALNGCSAPTSSQVSRKHQFEA